MSLVREQAKFLLDVTKLINMATSAGFTLTGGELWRTPEQQAIYVKTGRSKTMASNHLRRCAIDLNFFKDGKLTYDRATLQPIGDFWESLDPKNSWGGNWRSFKDIPHFERRP
jgi:peptidoglycan L-alanyl-D-glutamate endopeptidase CwlK